MFIDNTCTYIPFDYTCNDLTNSASCSIYKSCTWDDTSKTCNPITCADTKCTQSVQGFPSGSEGNYIFCV